MQTRLAVALAAVTALLAGCSSYDGTTDDEPVAPPPRASGRSAPDAGGDEAVPTVESAPPATAATVSHADVTWGAAAIARAQSWADQRVPFSHDPVWRGYPTDGAGLLSYAWGLAAPGARITMLAGGSCDDGGSVAVPWGDVRSGDALYDRGAAQVMIFAGWDDTTERGFHAYEAPGPGLRVQYTHHLVTDQRNGVAIHDAYVPIRARGRGVASPPPPPLPAPVVSWSCSASDLDGTQIWTCSGRARFKCVDGVAVEDVCAEACVGQPLGVDDFCR